MLTKFQEFINIRVYFQFASFEKLRKNIFGIKGAAEKIRLFSESQTENDWGTLFLQK
jgi:hypothetical protein